jgi:hypothetical protein
MHLGFKARKAGIKRLERTLDHAGKPVDLTDESFVEATLEASTDRTAFLLDKCLCDFVFHTATE